MVKCLMISKEPLSETHGQVGVGFDVRVIILVICRCTAGTKASAIVCYPARRSIPHRMEAVPHATMCGPSRWHGDTPVV